VKDKKTTYGFGIAGELIKHDTAFQTMIKIKAAIK